jgi:hypothetical protein
MNAVRRFFTRNTRKRSGYSRFDRYYSSVLSSGSGYPTADEARRDLRNYEKSTTSFQWPR